MSRGWGSDLSANGQHSWRGGHFATDKTVGSSVFAIDRWDAAYLLEKQPEQYERDAEAMDLLRREDSS